MVTNISYFNLILKILIKIVKQMFYSPIFFWKVNHLSLIYGFSFSKVILDLINRTINKKYYFKKKSFIDNTL